MANFDQNAMPYRMESIGPDLHLWRASLVDRINALYVVDADIISQDPAIELADLLGKNLTVKCYESFDSDDGSEVRTFGGVICEARRGGVMSQLSSAEEEWYRYEVIARPPAYFAGFRQRSNVYEKMTAGGIVNAIAQESYLPAPTTVSSHDDHDPREHSFQFQETDLDFLKRILQREGLNFLCQYDGSQHRMTTFGQNSSIGGAETSLNYDDSSLALIQNLIARQAAMVSTTTIRDYDQMRPRSDQSSAASYNLGKLEFEREIYPGDFSDGHSHTDLAKRWQQTSEGEAVTLAGKFNNPAVKVGDTVVISNHPIDKFDETYLVTEQSLSVTNAAAAGREGYDCTGRVGLVPEFVNIGPPRTHTRPPQRGLLTGKIVDEARNDPNNLGRVKVKFPFDSANSSTWCRVVRPWAGAEYGVQFDHMMDDEVLVAFLHDDPDRPTVIGGLHNDARRMPFEGEIQTRIGGIKTQNTNEIAFIDEDGAENIRVHAQFDMNAKIENDETREIVNDQSLTIGNDQTVDIGNNQTISISADGTVTAGGNILIEAGSSIELKVGGSSIKIETAKVTIKSTQIEIDASADLKAKSGGTGELSSLAPLTIKGAVVNIN